MLHRRPIPPHSAGSEAPRAPRRRLRAALLRAAAVGCGAAALSPAAAAADTPLFFAEGECYVPGVPLHLEGIGYTPGGDVVISFNVLGSGAGRNLFSKPFAAGAEGNWFATFRTPDLAVPNEIREQLVMAATDQVRSKANAPPEEQFATTSVELSAWGIEVAAWGSGQARPGKRTRVRAYGFGPVNGESFSGSLYAHYLRGGKLVKTVKVGELKEPCGDLQTRMRQFPFAARPGKYSVDFDAVKRYSKKAPGIRYRRVVVPKAGARAATVVVPGDPVRKGAVPSAPRAAGLR